MTKVKKHPYAGKGGCERRFIKIVHELARHRSHREVFEDFLELVYCAVAKCTFPPGHEDGEVLEARYMETVKHRDLDYVRRIPELLAIAQSALAPGGEGGDFLGRVSAELGALNGAADQYFTPFEVSKLMAGMILGDVGDIIDNQGFITLGEPASGAGGMILAAADAIEDQGFDPSVHMWAHATDISRTAFKMTYVQLSLRGIPADVVCGDTLSLECWEHAITPAKIRFVLHHGPRWVAYRDRSTVGPVVKSTGNSDLVALPPPQPTAAASSPSEPTVKTGQLSLFS